MCEWLTPAVIIVCCSGMCSVVKITTNINPSWAEPCFKIYFPLALHFSFSTVQVYIEQWADRHQRPNPQLSNILLWYNHGVIKQKLILHSDVFPQLTSKTVKQLFKKQERVQPKNEWSINIFSTSLFLWKTKGYIFFHLHTGLFHTGTFSDLCDHLRDPFLKFKGSYIFSFIKSPTLCETTINYKNNKFPKHFQGSTQ